MSEQISDPNHTKAATPTHGADGDSFSAPKPSGFRAGAFKLFELADDIMHLVVGALLVAVAAVVLLHVILTGFPLSDLGMVSQPKGMDSGATLFTIILSDVNNILFVVIVLEILATVLAYLRDRSFALRPFLIIGIVSSVRHILIVTANLSANTGSTGNTASKAIGPDQGINQSIEQVVELGVSAIVTVLLVLCYWFVGRTSDNRAG